MYAVKFEADVHDGTIKVPLSYRNLESKHLEIIAIVIDDSFSKEAKSDTYKKLEQLNEKLGGDELVELKLQNYPQNYEYNSNKSDDEVLMEALRAKYGE